MRATMGIAPIAPSAIQLLDDEALCQRASEARDSVYRGDPDVALV